MGLTIPPPPPIPACEQRQMRIKELECAELIIQEKENELKQEIDFVYNEALKKDSLIYLYGK